VGIGFAIGFVLQLVFGAIVYAGQAVSMTMGLGFAMAVDPQNGVQVPVLSQMYVILATLLFLSLNGHLILIATVIDSYQILPANLSGIPVSSLGAVAALGSKVFASGISLALPAMAAMLMVNVTFGVITRTAPQLNIFAVGFPMTLMGGFFVLFINMPNLIAALSQFLDQALMQVPAVFM
jgi:flagellar biosynthetic protein FliR